jgi:hypothetical protein
VAGPPGPWPTPRLEPEADGVTAPLPRRVSPKVTDSPPSRPGRQRCAAAIPNGPLDFRAPDSGLPGLMQTDNRVLGNPTIINRFRPLDLPTQRQTDQRSSGAENRAVLAGASVPTGTSVTLLIAGETSATRSTFGNGFVEQQNLLLVGRLKNRRPPFKVSSRHGRGRPLARRIATFSSLD